MAPLRLLRPTIAHGTFGWSYAAFLFHSAAQAQMAAADQLLAEFTEIESGRRDTNRPRLHAALAQCRKSGATLLIARLDRLARNVA
jgi:DNA invertase Pin-like site-specific DNA recombinase